MRVFQYTRNKSQIIEVELPGVHPKMVKVTYVDRTILVNSQPIATVGTAYNLFAAEAEMSHGLLKITIPEVTKPQGVIAIKAKAPETPTPTP